MAADLISRLFPPDKGTKPNKFTLGMGRLIRQAREQAGKSQEQLAREIYMRRPSLSDIENGKREPSASELLYLSYALEKPITYFFPDFYLRPLQTEELSAELQELLVLARRLGKHDLESFIAQVRAIGRLAGQ